MITSQCATPEGVQAGQGTLFIEAIDDANAVELFMMRTHAVELATMLEEDVPASLPDATTLKNQLSDTAATLASITQAIVQLYQLADQFCGVTGNTRVQAAVDELEQYFHNAWINHYAASRTPAKKPWIAIGLAALAVLGVAWGTGRVINHYRGRRYAHG